MKPAYRGQGIGKLMLAFLARLTVERDCGRLEWWCLDANEPAIRFYRKMGAQPMEDWTVYRVTGKALVDLAENFSQSS